MHSIDTQTYSVDCCSKRTLKVISAQNLHVQPLMTKLMSHGPSQICGHGKYDFVLIIQVSFQMSIGLKTVAYSLTSFLVFLSLRLFSYSTIQKANRAMITP